MGTRQRAVGELHGNECVRVSALFFVGPTRHTWNYNALSAQPPKKLFSKKILLSGSPTTEFYFPQKGRSVGQ
jgi:hypothetical protein